MHVRVDSSCMDEYKLLKVVGSGQTSKVHLASSKSNNTNIDRSSLPYKVSELVAVKVVPTYGKNISATLQREIVALKSIPKNEFIVELLDDFGVNERSKYSTHCIVMYPYLGTHKRAQTCDSNRMTLRDAGYHATEICEAIEHVHRSGYMHRDIKAANILLSHEGHAVLGDFGCAREIPSAGGKALTFCGTIHAMAPEMLEKSGHDEKVDNWALGILIFEMLIGGVPFSYNVGEEELSNKLKESSSDTWFKYEEERQLLGEEVQEIIVGLTRTDASSRLTFSEIRTRSFFCGAFTGLSGGQNQPPAVVADDVLIKPRHLVDPPPPKWSGYV